MNEQEMTSQQLLVQSDSSVVVTFTQEADTDLDCSEQRNDVVEKVSAIGKASSGYHMALGMVRGEVVREGGVGVTLPASKELLEVRQKKKVRAGGRMSLGWLTDECV